MIRTLIAEDEKWVMKGIVEIIDWEEHDMVLAGKAENGEEALELVRNVYPDLIITDMKMPKMDGAELLKSLADTGIDAEIIVISGYSEYDYMKQAISSKVFEYILKPVDESYLNKILARVCERIIKTREEKLYRENMKSRLISSRILLEESLLNNLIRSNGEKKEDLGRQLDEAGINMDFKYFCVSVIRIGSMPDNGNKAGIADFKVFSGICDYICQTLSNENINVFKNTNAADEIIILWKSNTLNYGRLTAWQKGTAEDIINRVKDSFGIVLKVTFGDWTNGIGNISSSCREAAHASKFECRNDFKIIFYNDIRTVHENEGRLFNLDEEQIIHNMDNLQEQDILNIVEMIFNDVKGRDYCNISLLKKEIIRLLIIMERACRKAGVDFSEALDQEGSFVDIIEGLSSIKGIESWTVGGIHKILLFLNAGKQRSSTDIIEEIKKHIDNCYFQEINLISIAQKYYMNHIYLSRLFKAQTGENFIDYITRVRMMKARELLERSGLKVKDVARLVGYNNPYYFTRSFTKFFGYTPTESV